VPYLPGKRKGEPGDLSATFFSLCRIEIYKQKYQEVLLMINKSKALMMALLVLALVTMACGIDINLPVRDVKTGPTETQDIRIPLPEGNDVVDVELAFGAGELRLEPGAADALIEGTATYNVPDFKPEITTGVNRVRIENGDLQINGIPNFRDDIKNEWDFRLGEAPMNLNLSAGAYQGRMELGGLSLQRLSITDGASDVRVNFSAPNRVEMSELRYETGASNVELAGLANANFDAMTFRSGAGDYTLNFSGDLQHDAMVNIETGISEITIIVPEGISARVSIDGGLNDVDARDGWDGSGDRYTLEGSGPTLTISVKMGAGHLELLNN
jgi:hypothetical protein